MPLGVSPNGKDFLPSGAVTSATTKVQLPTIWSLRPDGCAAAAPADRIVASKPAAVILNIRFLPEISWRAPYPGTHRRAMSRFASALSIPAAPREMKLEQSTAKRHGLRGLVSLPP